jgi:hypothetical protein
MLALSPVLGKTSNSHSLSKGEWSDHQSCPHHTMHHKIILGSSRLKIDLEGRSAIRIVIEENNTTMSSPLPETQQVMIADEPEIEKFYRSRFEHMQSSACTVMTQVFMKLLEPKKQTHHPYAKGTDGAPSWWPPITGEHGIRYEGPNQLQQSGKRRT